MIYYIKNSFPYSVHTVRDRTRDYFAKEYTNRIEAVYRSLKKQKTYFLFTEPNLEKYTNIVEKLEELFELHPEVFL